MLNENNIITWNINGAYAKYPELQQLIMDYHPLVVCLQETKLTPRNSFKIKNFETHRKDYDGDGNPKQGLLIAVSTQIHSEPVNIQSNLEVLAVKIFLNRPITVCNIYIHHTINLSEAYIQAIIDQLESPFILSGDFNAHNTLWGSNNITPRRRIIENIIEKNELILLNDGSATHFASANNTFTSIDLTLCSRTITSNLRWSVAPHLYTSDH